MKTAHVPEQPSRVNGGSEPQSDPPPFYEENAKVAAVFWEWRHKVLTLFFTFNGATIALMGWLYEKAPYRKEAAIPSLLGIALGIVCYCLDYRIAWVLEHCYQAGARIERKFTQEGSIFEAIHQAYPTIAFHSILRVVYLSSAVAFFILALVMLAWVK